ncbi:IclR family transcriptional regulator [Ancylobacter sp. 6x-1]|uniref:IclR family transcriptional regulator n=1 Tax=Ancylobacter crimeensis TaxID=2579147 RepID=A0ABT0DAB0_9HYPH|nr:IclR family transcriptional regulator [Ancylobacter crimeensis]MCK0196883.1 IclR family transcriptional regulator [Ancylobacter crimeensis]
MPAGIVDSALCDVSGQAMTDQDPHSTKSPAPALTKGFAILELLAETPGLRFAEIRARLNLPNSSCHHLVNTLCQLGALQMNEQRGYVLGLRLLELGARAVGQRQIEHQALPFLRRMSQELQLTCHLGVLEGHAAVYLLKVEGQREIRVNTWVGKRLSLHSSSLGKVLLAWLPAADVEDRLRHATWEQKGPKTITDPAQYRAHLAEVRDQGWALDDEEDNPNIRCIAAPVLDLHARVVAAISVVGTVLDVVPSHIDALAYAVRRTADEISRELGHRSLDETPEFRR